MNKIDLLQEYFGHNNFREFQEEAIDTILAKRDLLMILPTGGGKSLCYQLPSLMMGGVTIVISPLLALMYDQVTALRANGINSAMLSSLQSEKESKEIEELLKNGSIKLLYVAPERLNNFNFLSLLDTLDINFFVIDEAHCVSEWGHDFREDYRKLHLLKKRYPNTPISAFTATATYSVKHDIISNLTLSNPRVLQGVVYRENLNITIAPRQKDGRGELLEFLKAHKNQAGIIYTLSRKSTQSISDFLQSKGINALPYHAGLSREDKEKTYKAFVADEIEIVVATIAFGMGIDKSNIRFVVHLTMPKSIENYYQEIGRAGRDGLSADVVLLYSIQDTIQQKSFLEPLEDTPHKQNSISKIDSMFRYAKGEECRHKSLALYFGDTIDECKTNCDNCTQKDVKKSDITKASQKLLSTIYRTAQNFGIIYIIDILRGSKDKRILENAHDKLSVYGIGAEYSKNQWLSIADKLLEIGAIEIGAFRVYKLTDISTIILKGNYTVLIRSDRLEKRESIIKKRVTFFDDYDVEMFDLLKALRAKIAKEQGVPPYVIFSDKTLKELSIHKPSNQEEILQIHGIGEIKFKKYGKEFLKLIDEKSL